MGLKALAVYCDNCKVGQPLSDAGSTARTPRPTRPCRGDGRAKEIVEKAVYRPTRERLPKRRGSQTTSFTVGGAEGYLTAGTTTTAASARCSSSSASRAPRSPVSWTPSRSSLGRAAVRRAGWRRSSRSSRTCASSRPGMTDDPDVRMAQSLMDYVFRRLALDYLDFETRSFMRHPHRRRACPPARDRVLRPGRRGHR